MAQLSKSQFHDFVSGEIVTEENLDQNFELLRQAGNDTSARTDAIVKSYIVASPVAGTTVFTLPNSDSYNVNTGAIKVFKKTSTNTNLTAVTFTETSATTVTLSTATSAGDSIYIYYVDRELLSKFTGTITLPSTTSIGSVSATEIGYLNGVTSNIQTQINTINTNFDYEQAWVDSQLSLKENTANKATTMTGNTTSNVLFLTAKAVYDWATGLFVTKTEFDYEQAWVDSQLSLKENTANKATTMTGNTTSNTIFLTAKAVYDWAVGLFAPKDSPTFTGTPVAPTATADTNTTQLATTAYVVGQAGTTTPTMSGSASVGTSLKYARADHVHPSDTTKENTANKATTMTGNTTSNVLFLTAKAVYDWATGLFAPKSNPTFTGTVTLPSTTSIGSVDATELSYLDGVTSNIQTQINAISTGSGFVTKTGDTMTGALIGHADTPTASREYTPKTYVDSGLAGKADTTHTHSISNVTNLQTSLDSKENTTNKATTMTGNTTSNVVFLTAKAVYDWATGLFVSKSGDTMTGTLNLPTNGLTVGTSQVVVNSTGVGIGTTAPGTALDVVGNIRASSRFISTVATGTSPLSVASTTVVPNLNADQVDGKDASDFVAKTGDTMTDNLTLAKTSGDVRLTLNNTTTTTGKAYGILSTSGGQLRFRDVDTAIDRMVIDSSGNVGIGTPTPDGGLEVFNAKVIFRNSKTTNTNNSTRLFGGTYGGTLVTILAQDGTSTSNTITIGGGTSAGAPATNFVVQTAPYTTTEGNTGIERLKIDSAGAVKINGLAGTGTVALNVGADGTLIRSTSDERLKENIQPIQYGLKDVNLLKPVTFNWIDTELYGSNNDVGLIAQEVEPIIPHVVSVENAQYYLDYTKLIPVLIKAIQELNAKVEALEAHQVNETTLE